MLGHSIHMEMKTTQNSFVLYQGSVTREKEKQSLLIEPKYVYEIYC
jgi:hypothetical protein